MKISINDLVFIKKLNTSGRVTDRDGDNLIIDVSNSGIPSRELEVPSEEVEA